MQVTVNGEVRDLAPDTSVLGLIESLNLKPELTAVQINDRILERDLLSDTIISEGDTVELIRIVGGG